MPIDKLNELKSRCAMLAGFDPAKHKRSMPKTMRTVVHYFWVGALYALDEPTNPYVVICLASGRYADLCTPVQPEPPKVDLLTAEEATSVATAGAYTDDDDTSHLMGG